MKITTIDTSQYSFSLFDEYTRRAQIRIELPNNDSYQTDVYTTEINKDKFYKDLKNKFGDKVVDFEITHWTTRKSDDAQAEFIESWLKD